MSKTGNGESGSAAVLMLQGTASDVGKSVITAALCRIFMQDGFRTAPFKSQNMALNSYVTVDGKEIGRAQGMQAEACGIEATTDMNPILIKPTHDMHSQIVVHGRPLTNMSAAEYRSNYLPTAKPLVLESLGRLRSAYDIVVMEGAGSPAEINLKDRDIVNMNLADWADSPVLLVADIDRGGVFAFLVGTLELLEPHERKRVKGFIINKFRGDLSLLQPGLDWLEERTGIPVLGVLPYIHDLRLEAEDSVVLDKQPLKKQQTESPDIDIAVIRTPRISNFTDVDPLKEEPGVCVRFVSKPTELGNPDVIILPGTKNTIGDLAYIRSEGFETAIAEAMHSAGTQLVGICGGYQMLGKKLSDPSGMENSQVQEMNGLGYLPLTTLFTEEKRTVRVSGNLLERCPIPLDELYHNPSVQVEGYEIHMGSTTAPEDIEAKTYPLFEVAEAGGTLKPEGRGTADGRVWGTYLHGIFHNDEFRTGWLNAIRKAKGLEREAGTFSVKELKEKEFDLVAESVRKHLRMDAIYKLMGIG
ncbi:cobyric acid synthase [Paenibacillus sp.]|jgi:adenosylcobyric acid synthase|uniref:cobyric acid synthase n=1 Tax=Paenibacillus sp. TaxID=58172 RepID=UPI002834025F|nr:cobyric acid synthase [Paenibacillus sp.]MDR0269798.1 cobyric acid synthase [Paenibacillus sp.]